MCSYKMNVLEDSRICIIREMLLNASTRVLDSLTYIG